MPQENSHPYPPRRRRRRRRRINPTAIIFWLVVVLLILGIIALAVSCSGPSEEPAPSTEPTGIIQQTKPDPTTEPTTEPTVPTTEPPVTQTGSATISATGDMLMHLPCIRPGAQGDGTYDFTGYFPYLQPYIESADYAVANLETTLAGLDGGYEYHGFPNFNCPDGIVPSLKEVGFDMLLTANNHTYDTLSLGFFRTQQVIEEHGLDHIGTKTSLDVPDYLIKEIDGIQIGMICYTYETNADPYGVSLNGGADLKENEKDLINTFMKDDVASFTRDLAQDIADMEADGAEAIVLYIHWGEEYQLEQNSQQEAMAQAACDLGVDVIVGGHPHVIQPIDLLTSQTDPEHKTVCLYSTGNALSNQKLGNISYVHTAHTEDGILFSFSFAKYSDGTVRVEEVEALPLWINFYTGTTPYDILPLDQDVTDWSTTLVLDEWTLTKAEASFDRTMAIIGDGLQEVQTYLDSLPPIA
ncbi:MAG: CapA family protein [Oscillospiraceae bacterium]|nr:CapA family protein [Oscillospiraceae bacterium]